MSTVAVLNTDVSLSGKTLDLLESDQTITGQKTFSRNPSAPFVVAAGSAVVANLDADKLDGLDSTAFVNASTTQTANKVFAGPTSGSAAAPTFRVLTGADLTAPAAVRVLDRKVTTTDVVSSTAETAVYSFSVPAATLSTNKALRLTLIGDYLNNSGGGVNFTVKGKYGATVLGTTGAVAAVTSANRAGVFMQFDLRACNATNVQVAYSRVMVGGRTAATNAGVMAGAASADVYSTHVSVAEDSTGALTLQVTVQHDTNAATVSFRIFNAILELCE